MRLFYKIAYFIKPILKIKDNRYLTHSFLLIMMLEFIFPGSLFLTLDQSEVHMLLVQFAQMSASQGKIVEGEWKLKEFQEGDKVFYTTQYIDSDEEIKSATALEDVTSIKSYGRTLDGVMEGRWMFWYPGSVTKVIKRNGRSTAYSSDTFKGYCSVKGHPAAIGCFKGGHRNGWWKFYMADGSVDVMETGYYENDTLIKRGENPLFIAMIVLAILSLLVFDLILAKVIVWLDVTFKKADPDFSHT